MGIETINCRDLHLRHTSTTGQATVQCHRVWDADRFLAARQSEARELNAKAQVGEKAAAKVEMIDATTYQRERGAR